MAAYTIAGIKVFVSHMDCSEPVLPDRASLVDSKSEDKATMKILSLLE